MNQLPHVHMQSPFTTLVNDKKEFSTMDVQRIKPMEQFVGARLSQDSVSHLIAWQDKLDQEFDHLKLSDEKFHSHEVDDDSNTVEVGCQPLD